MKCSGIAGLTGALLIALVGAGARAADYMARYDLSANPRFVDLGVQPSAYPLAFISTVMQHDQLLHAGLKARGLTLRSFPFKKGNDMVNLVGQGKLEMAFVGDMPTVNTIIVGPTVVLGLGKRNFSSIVARNYERLDQLRGKRIGYSVGSSSHLVLLRGLEASGMSERDVVLVPLDPVAMPDALESGAVDAYSAWEPTPSISFERNARNKAIYRSMSTDWLIFPRQFAEGEPETAALLTASYVRAINWMRQSAANLGLAADWVLAASAAFTGEAPKLSKRRAIEIARKDLLDVPGVPAIPALLDGIPALAREFAFIKANGKVAAHLDDSIIRAAFRYDGLRQVQRDPKRYRLYEFDYAANGASAP